MKSNVGAAAMAVLGVIASAILVAPRPALAAGPQGLYMMTRMVMGSSLEIAGWYFKNGQVAENPRGDIARFDFKAAAAESPAVTGTFAISGKTMTMSWANGKKSTGDYEPGDHGCFYWDMGSFCPAEPFGKNQKLDGVFSGGASAGYGRVANATTLSLTSGGQYRLEQAGSVKSAPSGGTQLQAGSSGGETGTYELSGTVLTLKPSGGKPRQILAFPYDDGTKGPQPRRIFFDGAMLKRL
jgi:hypothetical protein